MGLGLWMIWASIGGQGAIDQVILLLIIRSLILGLFTVSFLWGERSQFKFLNSFHHSALQLANLDVR